MPKRFLEEFFVNGLIGSTSRRSRKPNIGMQPDPFRARSHVARAILAQKLDINGEEVGSAVKSYLEEIFKTDGMTQRIK